LPAVVAREWLARGGRMALGVVLAILKRFSFWIAIGMVGLVLVVFRDSLSGSVNDLMVGDCFDVPPGLLTLSDVQHHPCTGPHDAELIFETRFPGAATDAYPKKSAFTTFVGDQCRPAYRSYLGSDFDADPLYDMAYLFPTDESWTDGDRRVACLVQRVDRKPITGTVRVTR
jgi:hypothetical protein